MVRGVKESFCIPFLASGVNAIGGLLIEYGVDTGNALSASSIHFQWVRKCGEWFMCGRDQMLLGLQRFFLMGVAWLNLRAHLME